MSFNFKCIAIGGSAGSFSVVIEILKNLPADFSLPVLICMHRMKSGKEGFVNAINLKSQIKVLEPLDKESIRNNCVYLAPANYHMYIELNRTISLSTEEDYNYSRPSIDLMFNSAAYVYKKHLVGIVLSGANHDGARGLRTIKKFGGTSIIQNRNECLVQTMPLAAKKSTLIDHELKIKEIVSFLIKVHNNKLIQLNNLVKN